jgi:hypothetical protein
MINSFKKTVLLLSLLTNTSFANNTPCLDSINSFVKRNDPVFDLTMSIENYHADRGANRILSIEQQEHHLNVIKLGVNRLPLLLNTPDERKLFFVAISDLIVLSNSNIKMISNILKERIVALATKELESIHQLQRSQRSNQPWGIYEILAIAYFHNRREILSPIMSWHQFGGDEFRELRKASYDSVARDVFITLNLPIPQFSN